MCPFTTSLCALLLADADSGMQRDEIAVHIKEFATKWFNEAGTGPAEWNKTGARIALATLTTTNAVLGRPEKPRGVQQTVDELRARKDELSLLKAEQQIVRGWSDDGQTGLVARADAALTLAVDLEMFLAGMQTERVDVMSLFSRNAARDFFAFAQKECVNKGHGMQGLARAVGIVLGQVTIEEVVFG